jgi:type II secretory pathway pseudopilin PulG
MIRGRVAAGHDRGFAMAALLVMMSVMAIAMTVALPVYNTAARREREAELIFRGEQYARAVRLYQRRFPGATPPNLDVLLNEHLLRKKYKDPITNDDFQLVGPADGIALQGPAGATAPGLTPPGGPPAPGGRGGTSATSTTPTTRTTTPQPASGVRGPGAAVGGIMGVVSKSTDKSLRLYNGRDRYNEWVFVATQQSQRAGGPGTGASQPGIGGPNGQRGGPGQGPNATPNRGGFPPGGGFGGPPQPQPGGFGGPSQPSRR